MLQNLPTTTADLLKWTWGEIEPYYKDLQDRPLDENNIHEWLKDWSALVRRIDEIQLRLEVLTTVDTTDKESEEAYKKFFDEIFPKSQASENMLKQKRC